MKGIKLLCVCLIAAVFTGLLPSCGGEQEDPNTIVFWHPFGGAVEKKMVEDMAANYNASQDQYTVKALYVANLYEKLQTNMKGNNSPDVVYFDRYLVSQWAAQKLLYDVTDLAAQDGIKAEDFYQYSWEESTYNDRLYAIPLTVANYQLFYNKKMFRDAGYDPEKPPTTTAQLDEYAKKMTKKNGKMYETLGFIPWLNMGGLTTWGYAFGGDWWNAETGELTPDDPKNVEALEWFKGYAKEYGLAQISSFNSQAGSDLSIFASGKLGMCISGSWELTLYDEVKTLEYGIAPIPNPEGKDFRTWGGGFSMIMPFNAKHTEGGWDFIKYASVGQGAIDASNVRIMFPAYKEYTKGWVEDDPRYQPFLDAMENTISRPQFEACGYYMEQIGGASDKYLRGKGEAKDLLAKARTNTLSYLEDLHKNDGAAEKAE